MIGCILFVRTTLSAFQIEVCLYNHGTLFFFKKYIFFTFLLVSSTMSNIFDTKSHASRIQELSSTMLACINELVKSKGFQDTFQEDIRKAQELLEKKEEELRKQLCALEEFRGTKTTREDDYFIQSAKRLKSEQDAQMAQLMGSE